MKEIIKDVLNILKISFWMVFIAGIYFSFEVGELNFRILRLLYEVVIDYYVPYQLPALIFFYFWYKYNVKKK